jgi:pimeloyl-ACP methyl ester carboxylesterase
MVPNVAYSNDQQSLEHAVRRRTRQGPTVPFLKIRDELELFYTDEGEGSVPLLFVHGWTCDSHDWNWQLQHFAASRRVIAVDLRGHGLSTVLPGGYDPRQFAEDLALLLRALDVPKVVAVGHSLGGMVVSALAVEHPTLVDGVVAIEPSYGFSPAEAAPLVAAAEAMSVDNAVGMTLAMLDFADGPRLPGFFKAMHRRRVLAMQPHVVAEAFRTNWLGAAQFGTQAETEAYFAGRTCPALTVYAGGHEEATAWATSQARAGLDEVTYLPLGHWPHQEVPDLINSMISNWLQRLPSAHAVLTAVAAGESQD